MCCKITAAGRTGDVKEIAGMPGEQGLDILHLVFRLPHLLPSPQNLSTLSVSLLRDPWTLHCQQHVEMLEKTYGRVTVVIDDNMEKEVKVQYELL